MGGHPTWPSWRALGGELRQAGAKCGANCASELCPLPHGECPEMSDRASVDGHLAHSARIWGGRRTRAVRVARVPLRSRLEPVREAPAHAGRQEMLGVWARGRRAVGEGSPRRATASGQRPACGLGWERVKTAHGRVECGAPRAWRWHCVQAKPSLTYSTATRSTQVVGLVDPYPPEKK